MFVSKYSCLRDRFHRQVETENNKYPLTIREQVFVSIIDELLICLHEDEQKRETDMVKQGASETSSGGSTSTMGDTIPTVEQLLSSHEVDV